MPLRRPVNGLNRVGGPLKHEGGHQMLNRKSPHLTLAVVATVAAILIAGGAAIASNAGFKLNKGITLAGAGQVGDNWISLPYYQPYGTIGGFCTQTGLSSTGGALVPKAGVVEVDPLTGAPSPFTCGSAGAAARNLIAGRGYRVRQPNVAGAPTSLIIVGSHNPGLQLHIEDAGNGTAGDNWISPPYHTTAVSFNDFCQSSGLSSTGGALVPKAAITRVDATTGTPITRTCGSSGAQAEPLVLGESVRVREPNGPKDFIPAHY
jgi:hypothetical protein